MATTALKGNPVQTTGEFPGVGSEAPNFTLTNSALQDVELSSVSGKKVLSFFPSIDTPVCATSVRKFTEAAASIDGVTVMNISADLPFAFKRFCAAEGIENATTLSLFRNPDVGRQYGVTMADGPLHGLLARAVLVLDEANRVVHSELVDDISHEPNYDAALAAAKG